MELGRREEQIVEGLSGHVKLHSTVSLAQRAIFINAEGETIHLLLRIGCRET